MNHDVELFEEHERGFKKGQAAERNRIRSAIEDQYPHTEDLEEPCIRCDLLQIVHVDTLITEAADKDLRERLAKLIETLPFIWCGDTQLIQVSRDQVIEMVRRFGSE